MRSSVILFVLASAPVLILGEKELPSYINKCKRDDPQLNECMKKAIQGFGHRLDGGVKELKLPSLNPFVLPTANLRTSWMNATLTDLKLYNGHVYNVETLKMDLENDPSIEIDLTFPYMEIKAQYEIDGNLLQFAIRSKGKMECRLNDTKVLLGFKGTIVEKNGKKYLNLAGKHQKIMGYPLKYIYFHNLFPGNPELTDTINKVLLETQDAYTPDLYPLIEKIIGSVSLSLFKATYDRFSLDELYD